MLQMTQRNVALSKNKERNGITARYERRGYGVALVRWNTFKPIPSLPGKLTILGREPVPPSL